MVMGRSDKEQGPKLVRRPPRKTIIRDIGVGLLSSTLINCSPLRARSDKAKPREEIIKKEAAMLSPICRLST